MTPKSEKWIRPINRLIIPEDHHLYIPIADHSTADLLAHLEEICDFIDVNLADDRRQPSTTTSTTTGWQFDPPSWDDEPELGIPTEPSSGAAFRLAEPAGQPSSGRDEGKVLIHCVMGRSRSPAAAAAYLMRDSSRGGGTPLSAEEALGIVKAGRRVAGPNRGFVEQLRVWEGCGFELWEEGEGGVGRRRKGLYEEIVGRMLRERERGMDRREEVWWGQAGRRRPGGRGERSGRQAEAGGARVGVLRGLMRLAML